MLKRITDIDSDTVSRLFAIYEESMNDLAGSFSDAAAMKESYTAFLTDFISENGRLLLVEKTGGEWASCLRAVESAPGDWFIEAVETAPLFRRKGCAEMLLKHTAGLLKSLGAECAECIIAEDNIASIRLHEKCGFAKADKAPVNCWGELEKGGMLFRLKL